MSSFCPFQTREPKINESRCVIPLTLTPEELKMTKSYTGSWFCRFQDKENICPLYVEMYNWFKEHNSWEENEKEGDNPIFRIGTGSLSNSG